VVLGEDFASRGATRSVRHSLDCLIAFVAFGAIPTGCHKCANTSKAFRQTSPNEGEQGRTFRRPLSELKETTGPPLLLAVVDFLREFAKLLGLFVACFYL
jgi:hypothetical protein